MTTDDNKVTQESGKQEYEPPKIKILNEEEMLAAFQVTAGGSVSWWVM